MTKVVLAVALCVGALIAYVDSQPGWDDTGVTALAILVCCGVLGAAAPRWPWLWALAVGLWIPAAGILLTRNFGALLALPFAFAGAYGGMALRKALVPA
jgi:hypothetical protein